MAYRNLGFSVVVGIALVAVAAGLWQYGRRSSVQRVSLPDGIQALHHPDSTIAADRRFPRPRRLTVNGDVFLKIPTATAPLIVSSRLLLLTITGSAVLRVTAYARDTGEEVQVLCGDVVARKNYPSQYSEPDHLIGGQMTMVNQTIDLMEKETFNPAELRAWAKGLGVAPADLVCPGTA